MQNLRKQSRLCTYGSACGREQGLVYMFLIQKALSARADTSQPGVSPAQDTHVPLSKWGDVGFLALFALLS